MNNNDIREVRIWHTKRPFYLGTLIVLLLIITGLLISRAAKTASENDEISPRDPGDVDSEVGIPDPYGDEDADTPSSVSGEVTLGIGESGTIGSVTITPRSVVEDSRCPTDVTCIQAGRVVVSVDVNGDVIEIEEGQTREVVGRSLTLIDVTPNTHSSRQIQESEYQFTFSLT